MQRVFPEKRHDAADAGLKRPKTAKGALRRSRPSWARIDYVQPPSLMAVEIGTTSAAIGTITRTRTQNLRPKRATISTEIGELFWFRIAILLRKKHRALVVAATWAFCLLAEAPLSKRASISLGDACYYLHRDCRVFVAMHRYPPPKGKSPCRCNDLGFLLVDRGTAATPTVAAARSPVTTSPGVATPPLRP